MQNMIDMLNLQLEVGDHVNPEIAIDLHVTIYQLYFILLIPYFLMEHRFDLIFIYSVVIVCFLSGSIALTNIALGLLLFVWTIKYQI